MANDALTIERVIEDNFDDFLFLIEKLAEYERLDPPDEEAGMRLKRDGMAENARYEAFLGRIDGRAVAYVVFFETYSSFLAMPTLYLEDIFVLESHRRKGFGRAMFEFCVKRAEEKGCGRMEWCVLDWNTPAIHFYEKNGAQRLGWSFFRLSRDRFSTFH